MEHHVNWWTFIKIEVIGIGLFITNLLKEVCTKTHPDKHREQQILRKNLLRKLLQTNLTRMGSYNLKQQ